jgi:hypothetical protein
MRKLGIISKVLAVLTLILALFAVLGYWQSSYGYFMKFTPIAEPSSFIEIYNVNPDQELAVANPGQFVRIGPSLDKYNLGFFVEALPYYDYNIKYLDDYYNVTLLYRETPLGGIPDFTPYAFHYLFWLIAIFFLLLGTFAIRRYLGDVAK